MNNNPLALMWKNLMVDVPVSEGNRAFHIHVLDGINGAVALANKRLKSIDPATVPRIKAARQAEIMHGLKARLEDRCKGGSNYWRERKSILENEMEALVHPPMPDDHMQALRAELKLQAIRSEVLALPADKRLIAVMDAAQRGVPGLLHALEGGVCPVLPPEHAGRVKEMFLTAICPEKLGYLENTQAMLHECERAMALSGTAFANAMYQQHQVSPDWQRVTPAQMVEGWSENRKMQFEAANGKAAYGALLRNGTGYVLPADAEPIPTIA